MHLTKKAHFFTCIPKMFERKTYRIAISVGAVSSPLTQLIAVYGENETTPHGEGELVPEKCSSSIKLRHSFDSPWGFTALLFTSSRSNESAHAYSIESFK